MTCPKCDNDSQVIDTANLEVVTYRKRRCFNCGNIFYTVEQDCDYEEAEREIKDYRNAKRRKQRREKKQSD